MLPDAVQVADPFHVVKLANTKLDECREQNEMLRHHCHKSDPLHRCRRVLTKAEERLTEKGETTSWASYRLDPKGDVATMRQAKDAVRELYVHGDADLALQWVTDLGRDLEDNDYPTDTLRGQAELGTPLNGQTPLISEAPVVTSSPRQ